MADKHAPWYNGKIADPSHAVLAWQQYYCPIYFCTIIVDWQKKLLEKSY